MVARVQLTPETPAPHETASQFGCLISQGGVSLIDTISAIILAGGRSSRMGTDKALLPLPAKPVITFVEHLTSLLASSCHKVLRVARDAVQSADYAPVLTSDVRLLTDETPNIG